MGSASDKYDQRYQDGYQSVADKTKIERLKHILNLLGLPERGRALDFGGGSGIYTKELSRLLPDWEITCADISKVALQACKKKLPDVNCMDVADLKNNAAYFDFIFSNHVLEHVQDINATFDLFSLVSRKEAYMLHILPCGNEGSFEYRICSIVKEGMDCDHGNRFFYEDESHLRRLTSVQLDQLSLRSGFGKIDEYYANHFYGAVKWIAGSGRAFLSELFAYKKATTKYNAIKLFEYKCIFEILSVLFRIREFANKPASNCERKMLKLLLYFSLAIPASRFACRYIERRADLEFSQKPVSPAGSEMYMAYKRQ